MMVLARVLIALGALCGAAGVAAAASASHMGSRNLDAIALICLAHGPALLALGLHGRGKVLLWGGAALATGTAVFGLDLISREVIERSLFSGAAPTGGGLMILGWLVVAAGAFASGPARN